MSIGNGHLGIGLGLKKGLGDGGGFVPPNRPAPEEIGTIFTDTFNRSSGLGANYTTSGAATWTVNNGNDLVISGGALGFTSYARYSAYSTCLENFEITSNYTVGTINSTSYGIGFGVRSTNTVTPLNWSCRFITDSGADKGKIALYEDDTLIGGLSTAINVNAGDNITLTFTRNKTTYTCTILNNTNAETVIKSYTVPYTIGSGVYCNNTGNFSIWSFGGDNTVHSWSVSSNAYKNVKSCFIGDSITNGEISGGLAYRFATLINADNSVSYHVNAGGADKTQDCLNRIEELKSINAENYFLMIGGNDIASRVLQATWEANYTSLVSELKSIGARVIHLTPTARTATNVTALRTFINTNFASDIIIDTYTRTVGTGTSLAPRYDAGGSDGGVHPNMSGHRDIADYIMDNATQYLPLAAQTLDSATTAFATRVDAVTSFPIGWTRREIYNDLITYLKSNTGVDGVTSLWDSIDVLTIFNSFEENCGLLNIKSSSHNYTKAGVTPLVFAIDSFYDGNGSGYLNTNFNPADGGTYNFTQDNACYGAWFENNAALAVTDAGALDGSNLGFSFNPRDASNRYSVRVNNGVSTAITGVTDHSQLVVLKRTASNTIRGFRNSTELTGSPATNNSSVFVNANIYSFASNNKGTAASFSSRNKRADFFGSSNIDSGKMYTALSNYFANFNIIT